MSATPDVSFDWNDPENGHPFWSRTAENLIKNLARVAPASSTEAQNEDAAQLAKRLTPSQLRAAVQNGNLPQMYAWSDEIWEGIKVHVEKIVSAHKAD